MQYTKIIALAACAMLVLKLRMTQAMNFKCSACSARQESTKMKPAKIIASHVQLTQRLWLVPPRYLIAHAILDMNQIIYQVKRPYPVGVCTLIIIIQRFGLRILF
tara:strand:- start:1842 stop:2156 length:315 start_codon:yes stop_codon:yes gene_type:complete